MFPWLLILVTCIYLVILDAIFWPDYCTYPDRGKCVDCFPSDDGVMYKPGQGPSDDEDGQRRLLSSLPLLLSTTSSASSVGSWLGMARSRSRRRLEHETSSAAREDGALSAPGSNGQLKKDGEHPEAGPKESEKGWYFKTTNRKGCQYGFGPHNKTTYT